MIPPVTGNGMSLAFESAALAAPPLVAYSRGDLTWTDTRRQIAAACDRAFAPRLAWARWLQWVMLTPVVPAALKASFVRVDGLWRLLFARTR